MGTVPMLLMVIAATGITYGWQPEKNRTDGSMQYIIQVSPSELAEIEKQGEFSSVIDPRVRGRVSRVIIRVGHGAVPRTDPPVVVQVDDSRRPDDTVAPEDRIAVLKPAPVPQSGGFAVPDSLTKSLDGASQNVANGVSQGIDQAGRTIADTARNAISGLSKPNSANTPPPAADTVRVPPPSTRTPPFTSSAYNNPSELAGARSGGPSTAPNPARSNDWTPFPVTAPPARTNSQSASTSPPSATSPPAATLPPSTTSSSTSYGATGLGSNDSFGMLPKALETNNPFRASTQQPNTNSGFTSNGAATNPASPSRMTLEEQRLAEERQRLDQQRRLEEQRRLDQQRASWESSSQTAQSSTNVNGGSTFDYSRSTASAAPQFQPRSTPNPNLTQAQIQSGAWDLDSYGRPIDRRGNLIDTRGAYAQTGQDYRDRESSYPGFQTTLTDPRNTTTQINPPTQRYQDAYPRSADYPGYADARSANTSSTRLTPRLPDDRLAQYTQPDRTIPERTLPVDSTTLARQTTARADDEASKSLSDRLRPTETEATGSLTKPTIGTTRQVAAQPLFNGLLLISAVANVYLIFWLKNLRVQFKELVTAKRMSSSSGSVAT